MPHAYLTPVYPHVPPNMESVLLSIPTFPPWLPFYPYCCHVKFDHRCLHTFACSFLFPLVAPVFLQHSWLPPLLLSFRIFLFGLTPILLFTPRPLDSVLLSLLLPFPPFAVPYFLVLLPSGRDALFQSSTTETPF